MTNSLLAAAHFTLTHRETGRVLLHDLCFSLMPGERLTVIGPSGSGKTLICRAILGQLSPQTFAASGALSFGGYDLLALERHIRCSLYGSRIAFVPQNPMTAWARSSVWGANGALAAVGAVAAEGGSLGRLREGLRSSGAHRSE